MPLRLTIHDGARPSPRTTGQALKMNRWILCRATDAAVSLRAMRCGEEKKIAPADAMMIYRGRRGVVQKQPQLGAETNAGE